MFCWEISEIIGSSIKTNFQHVPIVSLVCAFLLSDRGDASRSPIVKVKRRLTLFLVELVALLTLSAVAPLPDNFNKMLEINLDQEMISPF